MLRHDGVLATTSALGRSRFLLNEVSTVGTDEFLDTQFEGDRHVLKKIGLVAAATIGLSLAATPAFATPTDDVPIVCDSPCGGGANITFADAYWTFIQGGADLGRGAAEVVAGAYAGIATTPALIAHSFTCGGGC